MTAFEWVRAVIGAVFLLGGTFFMVSAVIGNYRFDNALARMHAAGLGDTLGLLLILIGIVVICGISAWTAKLAVILVLLWTSSPAVTHLIMKMEIRSGTGADGKPQKEGKRKQ